MHAQTRILAVLALPAAVLLFRKLASLHGLTLHGFIKECLTFHLTVKLGVRTHFLMQFQVERSFINNSSRALVPKKHCESLQPSAGLMHVERIHAIDAHGKSRFS